MGVCWFIGLSFTSSWTATLVRSRCNHRTIHRRQHTQLDLRTSSIKPCYPPAFHSLLFTSQFNMSVKVSVETYFFGASPGFSCHVLRNFFMPSLNFGPHPTKTLTGSSTFLRIIGWRPAYAATGDCGVSLSDHRFPPVSET